MNISNRTLLFADDDRQVLDLYRKTFARQGFNVLTCQKPNDVVDLIYSQEVDLLVLDLKMPHWNSMELLPLLNKFRAKLPVIVVSGHYADMTDYFTKNDFGVIAFYQKPVIMSVLLEKVQKVLGVTVP